jgi:CRP/FNR family transcriptional regulator, dissimilatory nitrate respiration regulator
MIAIMSNQLRSFFEALRGQELAFPAGRHVFQLGDPVQLIYLVRSGSIFLTRHQHDGTVLVLQRATAGSVVAEASVYSDRYHCAAEAQADSTTWCVSRREVTRHLTADRSFAMAWSQHLAHEVQRARLQAEIVSLKTVAARVNAWIACNGTLPPKGEWSALAVQIGVSPEALYRELARRRSRITDTFR